MDSAANDRKESLLSVLYVSSATSLFSSEQLADYLRSWRDYNRRHRITGFLLYEGGNIMQILEGPPADVDALVRAIAEDSRHRRMLILWRSAIPEREFESWHMGYRNVSELSPEDREAFSSLLQDSKLDEEFRSHPGRSHQFLLEFKNVCLRQ